MSATLATGRRRPLVALACRVPVVAEAVASSLDGLVDVHALPTSKDDLDVLLRWIAPDVIVVDSEDEAEAAAGFVAEGPTHVFHLCSRTGTIRRFAFGAWEPIEETGASAATVRNLVLAGIAFRADVSRGRG